MMLGDLVGHLVYCQVGRDLVANDLKICSSEQEICLYHHLEVQPHQPSYK